MGTSTYLGELDEGESTGFALSCQVSEDKLPPKIGVVVKYLASPENWKEARREVSVEGPQPTEQPSKTAVNMTDPRYAVVWAVAGLVIGLVVGKVVFGRRSEEVEVP